MTKIPMHPVETAQVQDFGADMDATNFPNEEKFAIWIEQEKYKKHFQLARSLQATTETAMLKGGTSELGVYFPKAIALILAKGYKSFSSALALGRIAHTEDMGIVVRSLFNLYVIAKWISTRDSEVRAQRYIHWYWIEMHNLLELLPEVPHEASIVIEEEFIKSKPLFEYEDKNGKLVLPNHWHKSNVKEMADETGLTQHYKIVYKPLSAIEHSSPLSFFGMLSDSADPGDVTNIALRDHRFVPYYIGYGYQYLAGILFLWNGQFRALQEEALKAQIKESLSFFAPKNQPIR